MLKTRQKWTKLETFTAYVVPNTTGVYGPWTHGECAAFLSWLLDTGQLFSVGYRSFVAVRYVHLASCGIACWLMMNACGMRVRGSDVVRIRRLNGASTGSVAAAAAAVRSLREHESSRVGCAAAGHECRSEPPLCHLKLRL